MPVADETPDRPAWLTWLTTAVPPASLIVALLVYFAWERRIAQSAALGFDSSILAEPSIPAFLVRSVGALYVPLVVLSVATLGALWLDRWLRAQLVDRRKLRSMMRVSWLFPTVVIGLLPIAGVIALSGPWARAYTALALPFLLAAAVQALRYGAALRRAVHAKLPTRSKPAVSRPIAESLLSGFLIALLLFAGVDGFAQVVGRGLAAEVIDDPLGTTKPVLVYSAADLQIAAEDATATELPIRGDAGYRHRYAGLRLAFVDGTSYFLISRAWGPSGGKLIVLKQDEVRIEFIR